jgi:Cof subfamily protein (haloacid dehalogenase superfamily)
MRNLIFLDIDGTIVSEDGFLPDSAPKAIAAARAKGNAVLINTGRTAMNVDPFLREMQFDGYVYGCGTELEFAGETLFHIRQSPERSKEMVTLVRNTGMAVLYECSDGIFYDKKSRMLPGLQSLLDLYRGKNTDFSQVPEEGWQMDKFVIWYDSDSDLTGFQNGIAGKFDYIDRGNQFAELVPCGYSKATGMQHMMKLLQATPDRTYAIGDSLNDRPMLEAAGTGIAMGDNPKLSPYADYITANLADDGLAKALEHFALI